MRLWRIMDAYLRRFLFSSDSKFQGASVNSAQGPSGEAFCDHSKHLEASCTVKQNTNNRSWRGFPLCRCSFICGQEEHGSSQPICIRHPLLHPSQGIWGDDVKINEKRVSMFILSLFTLNMFCAGAMKRGNQNPVRRITSAPEGTYPTRPQKRSSHSSLRRPGVTPMAFFALKYKPIVDSYLQMPFCKVN